MEIKEPAMKRSKLKRSDMLSKIRNHTEDLDREDFLRMYNHIYDTYLNLLDIDWDK